MTVFIGFFLKIHRNSLEFKIFVVYLAKIKELFNQTQSSFLFCLKFHNL